MVWVRKGMVVASVVTLGWGIVGCETSKGPVVGDGTEVARGTVGAGAEGGGEPAVKGNALDASALIGSAQRLRDQRFERVPALESTLGALPRGEMGQWSEAAHQDRAAIVRGLFGVDEALAAVTSSRHELAVYERENHRVVYRGGLEQTPALRGAIMMALVEALETEKLARLSPASDPASNPASTWDEALAAQALRRGSGAFVAALDRLEQEGRDLDARQLALRPELALGLDGIGLWLEEGAPTSFADYLELASRGFALREGLGWVAALHRSGGWSAVEFGLGEKPGQTAQVVRADRWLRGEGAGQWTLARELDETRQKTGYRLDKSGEVGPAITAIWLAQVVDPRSARSVYAGWRADVYRLWEGDEKGRGLFEWVSQWDTPHSAHQVAEAIGVAMQQRFAEAAEQHVRVVREGLNVAVVISEAATDGKVLENGAMLLVKSTVGYVPAEAKPLEFVSTLLDRYVKAAHEARLDEDTWRDSAAGVTMELSPFKAWQVQKTDETGVRWFARHADGALVQMTTELFSPLLPSFGSEAYVEHIGGVFAATMAGEVETVERRDDRFGPGLEVRIEGTIEGESRKLIVWQWLRGEVLITYSLQTTPGRLDARAHEARAALESLEAFAEPAVGAEAFAGVGADDGILEFKVED